MIHEKFLPLTRQQLLSYFADAKQKGKCVKNEKHLKYYEDSIQKYKEYLANNPNRLRYSPSYKINYYTR